MQQSGTFADRYLLLDEQIQGGTAILHKAYDQQKRRLSL